MEVLENEKLIEHLTKGFIVGEYWINKYTLSHCLNSNNQKEAPNMRYDVFCISLG